MGEGELVVSPFDDQPAAALDNVQELADVGCGGVTASPRHRLPQPAAEGIAIDPVALRSQVYQPLLHFKPYLAEPPLHLLEGVGILGDVAEFVDRLQVGLDDVLVEEGFAVRQGGPVAKEVRP